MLLFRHENTTCCYLRWNKSSIHTGEYWTLAQIILIWMLRQMDVHKKKLPCKHKLNRCDTKSLWWTIHILDCGQFSESNFSCIEVLPWQLSVTKGSWYILSLSASLNFPEGDENGLLFIYSCQKGSSYIHTTDLFVSNCKLCNVKESLNFGNSSLPRP